MHIGIAGPILTDSLKTYLELSKNYPKGLGGSSVNNLIIGLLRLGHKVSVYTLDIEVKEPIILEGSKLKIYFGEYRARGRSRMIDFFRKEYLQIKEFIEADKPDIVSAQWGYEFAIGTIKSGYPHIITLRDIPFEILKLKKDLYRFVRLLMNYWVMRNGKHFVANSPYTAEKLKIFKKKLPVIPNSILSEWIAKQPKEYPEREIKIVSFLTGWGKRKNPQPALKAFSSLRKEYGKKIEYHLFGPGYELNGEGYNWAKKNNLIEGVYFNGSIPHHEVMEILSDYDILLHPAKEESFGMTLIEAMAKGLPVVAGKDSGAVPWVLNYGENGILVDVTSPDEIKNAIERLVNDRVLYKKLSEYGLAYVMKNFGDINTASKYLDICNKILDE